MTKKKPAEKKKAKKKPTRPSEICLWAHVHGEFGEIVRATVAAMVGAGMPLPERYQVPFKTKGKRQPWRTTRVEAALENIDADCRAVLFEWGPARALIYRTPKETERDPVHVEVRTFGGEGTTATLRLFNRACFAVLEHFFEAGTLTLAEHRPIYMAEAVPHAPGTNHNAYTTLVSTREIKRAYVDPDVFWDAWDGRTSKRSKHLVHRGLEHVEGAAFFKRLQVDQWAMARSAKPGLTEYYMPDPNESEQRVFRAGRSRLREVGYVAAEDTYELTCTLEKGEQIPPWQMYVVWNAIQQGATASGQTFSTLRVVFLDEWAARQERTPLLDIGARVYYYDDSGELRELRTRKLRRIEKPH